MEAVGLAIGIVGLAGQLAKVSQEWSNIFSEMKEIGYAHDSVLHDLRTEGLRLKQWEQAWGLDGTSSQLLDPSDERYRYAVASLARIVAVFTNVAELQAQYQGVPERDGIHGKPDRLIPVGRLFSRFRSKSPRPGSANGSQPASPNPQPSLTSVDLKLLENPRILANEQLLPGLKEEIACLSRVAQNLERSVPTYRKLRWASTDKARCKELVSQLTHYINGLFNVLPPADRMPQTRSLNLSFDIPFSLPDVRRNTDFVGREDLLEQLKQEIEKGAATKDVNQLVLHGMGGIGKTHLAMEYVYRHSGDYSSVFWINAASEQATKISFTHIMQRLIKHHANLSGPEPNYKLIGQLLGMAGRLDSAGTFTVQQPSEEQHVVDSVKEWLTAKDNTKWILVFDNLDDLESFDVNDYIPSAPHGTVIITSRRPESIQGRRGIEVQQMSNSEAEELLLKSAKLDLEKLPLDEREREKQAISTIVHKLGYLPLAIEQAGAYIHIRQYSFSRYLREYNTNITSLLSKKWKIGKRDRSVFAAWELSFNAIQNQNPEAAELLLLCGFLDNNDICEVLLQRGMKLPVNDTALGDLIHILFSYSMVKRKGSDDSFNIHPLVHVWAQWKLEMEPERHSRKATEAILLVASAIAIPKNRERVVEDWVFERRILPHIFAVERQIKAMAIEKKEILEAVHNLCIVYREHGHYTKAEDLCKITLAGYEKLLGADHLDTLSMIYNMALIYGGQGQYSKALDLYEQALAGTEKALGADHLHTLGMANNIAGIYYKQGHYDKAIELLERVLAGKERTLGADHSDTLGTVNNLALLSEKQGQYGKALDLYKRALAGVEKALGADHPVTLMTVGNIALLFHQQGQYTQALELYERVLAGREKALGADHPDTLNTLNGMAAILHNQRQYTKALQLFERALAGMQGALGADHLHTLNIIDNMAGIFYDQGQYTTALELLERALAGREKTLGADHPNTLGAVNNMALVLHELGQHDRSLVLFARALAGREKALGADHPDTISTVNNMAQVSHEQGQHDTALELYHRAVTGREKALGAAHPHTLATIRNMANLLEEIGQSDKAQELRSRGGSSPQDVS
ncbi:hypothetical protein BDZ91DRAFT_112651 [Kalaharituber pfeilii]|nr:hypothetical protein BDZ91DRAFT_112651 [Kalaharituber pfeilii]